MAYLIMGRIDPVKTAEGRLLASAGKLNPPSGVRHLFEYEEPDGSYFEAVESRDAEAVRRYVQKSAHLFKSMEFHNAAVSRLSRAAPGRPIYALYYVLAGNERVLSGDEHVRAVVNVSYEGRRGILVVQAGDHPSLYRFVAHILPFVTEMRAAPVMGAGQVWKTVLGVEWTKDEGRPST